MSDQKIRDILSKAKGQTKLTEQAVRTLIERDHKFLLELVTPYLDGIIAHSIDRARKATGLAEPKIEPLPKTLRKSKPAPAPAAKPLPEGGLDSLLSAWAKKFDTDEKPASKKASAQHIDAIRALSKKK
jgi:hypothetical protein